MGAYEVAHGELAAMGYPLIYASKMNLATMARPKQSMFIGYCFVNLGHGYLSYGS